MSEGGSSTSAEGAPTSTNGRWSAEGAPTPRRQPEIDGVCLVCILRLYVSGGVFIIHQISYKKSAGNGGADLNIFITSKSLPRRSPGRAIVVGKHLPCGGSRGHAQACMHMVQGLGGVSIDPKRHTYKSGGCLCPKVRP